MRTFASLTEALSRYRGKGEQKMIVEHVHVHKGGQAIARVHPRPRCMWFIAWECCPTSSGNSHAFANRTI